MTSLGKRKKLVLRRSLAQHRYFSEHKDEPWSRESALGREFGSPDFDRLMAEDHRNRTGVFDSDLNSKVV